MIWHPKPGQKVRIHYRKSLQGNMPCQGLVGIVLGASRGPGPRNACIMCTYKETVWKEIVPRGNLQVEKPPLEKAIDKICKTLPEEFEISICMEQGSAWVEMVDERGKLYDIETTDRTLSEQLLEALKKAKEAHYGSGR